jgi:DtxR family Mn-dependent transcriptional regulator
MPTVNSMIKKLAQEKLVKYEKYRPIELTEKGSKVALAILRKHRLTELFLTKVMDLGWEEVHDIAEQVEHIQSDRFFDRIDEMLGFPQFDPHGEPIPTVNGELPVLKAIPLADAKTNKKYKLAGVTNHHPAFLSYLDKIGLAIDGTIEVKTILDFDKSMEVLLNGKRTTVFSAEVSNSLLIK